MSKVSSRGQITIPVEIQRKMGMGPGTHIEMEIEDSRVILRKGRPAQGQDPVDRYYGYLRRPRSTDKLIEEMRGPGLEPELDVQRQRGK